MAKENSRAERLTSASLGKLNTYTPINIQYEITADASSGLTFNVPYGIKITGVKAISTATVASATVTLSDGTNDISDAIDIDTVDVVANAGTIDLTYASIAKNTALTVTTVSAADRALVIVEGVRI